MTQLKLTGIILLLITQFNVFGQSNKWSSLSGKDYSIEYPEKWDLDQSGQMGTSFLVFSELTSDNDQFRENVNLIVQDLTGHEIDLDQYVEISEAQVETMITDGTIISSNRIKSGGTEFQKVIYTGKQGIFSLKFQQHYWVENDKAYILTFTCEESEFNNFMEVGEKLLASFKIK